MKFRCNILLWFGMAIPAIAQPSTTPAPVQTFQNAFEEYINSEIVPHAPGLAVTVVIDGKPILTKGYGVRKLGSNKKVDSSTVFRLASVSKTFASAAAGTLVQNNKLAWDNKVSKHLKHIRFKNPDYTQKITLRHVLSHTTGLMPHTYTNLIEERMSYERILKKVSGVDFICMPGSCYGYQNIVYSLSGDIIESVSNNSFENIVQNNLFDPLQMKNSSYGLKAFINSENHATPHVWSKKRDKWIPIKVKNSYYKVPPAAGMNSSINDMTQWLMMQLGHYENVLSKATLSSMHSKQIKTTQRQGHYRRKYWEKLDNVHYGLGWRIFDFKGQKNYIHHGGWVQGARAEMVFNPELQMGMVFLTNSETRYANEIVPRFLKIYNQHFITDKKNTMNKLAQDGQEKSIYDNE